MRTRAEIEGDRVVASSVVVRDVEQTFFAIMQEQHLNLEVLLDIRELLVTNRADVVKLVNLASLSNEQWGAIRHWVKEMAAETVADIMKVSYAKE